MFIQVIQGQVTDPVEIREAMESWLRDLAAGSHGWLGTTSGVTSGGEFIAVVRFESPEAARRNGERPDQHQWWVETSKLFAGGATFHDCSMTERILTGGSDQAGFVQILQGRTSEPARLREAAHQLEAALQSYRPDVIGGTIAFHGDSPQMFTEAVYFTSEAAAREGERKEPPPELRQSMPDELFQDVRYLDLPEPWLYSPIR